MFGKHCARLLGIAICLLLAPAAQADLLVPGDLLDGKSQAQWSASWWQTMMSISGTKNPVRDTTGEDAHRGNKGSVYLLAGSVATDPIVREITVGRHQTLFTPIINAISGDPFFPAYGSGEANWREDIRQGMGFPTSGKAPGTTLFATLDGVDLESPSALHLFRQKSPPGLFSVRIAEDGGMFAGFGFVPGTYDAVSDGYYMAVAPLSVGTHTLRFGGAFKGTGLYDGFSFSQDITYNITVKTPAPPALLMLATAGLALLGRRLLRRDRPAAA